MTMKLALKCKKQLDDTASSFITLTKNDYFTPFLLFIFS